MIRNIKRVPPVLLIAVLLGLAILVNAPAIARKKSPKEAIPDSSPVSMCMFPVVIGSDGRQNIITRAGYQVNIPGLGIAPDAKQIALYSDGQNHFWYVDKSGHSIKMTDQQVEWGMAQINQQAAAAQQNSAALQGQQTVVQPHGGVAPNSVAPVYVQQPAPTVVVQNSSPAPSSSAAGSALVTGVAAAGGAMAGAALTNSLYRNNYYGVPYGTPVYHQGGHYYYHGANGAKVYVAPNSHYTNQWNQQKNYRADRYEHHKDQFHSLNKNQQQALKNTAAINSHARQTQRAATGRAYGGRRH
jgi:hypothetical protein